MSTLYVLATDGTHAPYEESQVREMLLQQYLTPDTLYWREGMTEWRPLRDLPPPLTASPAGSPPASTSHSAYHFTKHPEPLATIVKVMLALGLLIALFTLCGAIGDLLFGLGLSTDLNSANKLDSVMSVLATLSAAIYFLTVIPFSMWIYRMNKNCWGFTSGLKYMPGWSVGCFFVPIANLVYPCQAVQEIWKVSIDPAQWKTARNSGLVGCWWASWLITCVMGQILIHMPKVENPETLKNTAIVILVFEVSKITLCILAGVMVHQITQNQKRLVQSSPHLPG